MTKQVSANIITKTDTTSNWNTYNPILKKGEIGVEVATDGLIYIKIGNGVSNWKNLRYVSNKITDDTTGKEYFLGIDNELLYILSLS